MEPVYTQSDSKFGQWQCRHFRFAAGAAICEAGHVQAHARKQSSKDEDADDANGQILNRDVYNRTSFLSALKY